jgi:hypothetical protein
VPYIRKRDGRDGDRRGLTRQHGEIVVVGGRVCVYIFGTYAGYFQKRWAKMGEDGAGVRRWAGGSGSGGGAGMRWTWRFGVTPDS